MEVVIFLIGPRTGIDRLDKDLSIGQMQGELNTKLNLWYQFLVETATSLFGTPKSHIYKD